MLWRLFTSSFAIKKYHHGEDPWAIVTGASDGIGKELCRSLAQRGFNVFLHGRDSDKLILVRNSLATQFPNARFEVAVADATRPGLVTEVAAVLAGKNLTIVINNAGYTGAPIQPFTSFSSNELERGTNIGVGWITQLTHVVLPTLIENKPSLMVNIGSFVESQPSPFLAVYSGTKGYTRAFSHALRLEMQALGHNDVEIQYHEVHGVATKANGEPESLIVPSPRNMAEAIVSAVGKRSSFIVPYWVHELFTWAFMVVPNRFLQMMMISEVGKRRTDLKGNIG
ncbi:hypothetical protein JAAARDRAFT_67729 [Jaapia argillacea MUCL 33604]|uniref:NAD(P)-binding protein n=1 Tax=Jaapia argillacea MUCL 33604 TaxID=933084 RepID=A0A067Q1P6_9AGAM|nr:hypothetical protein JAAARDRAFT_67729 [Jaapia argillacea MUCL 33604]